jgi:hypothetical protein
MILDMDLIKQVWGRSGGVCECKRIGCQHPGGRCTSTLSEKKFNDDEGGWYVRPVNEFGPEKLFNVEAVCPECHHKVKPAGKAKHDTISSDRSDTLSI